MKRPASDGGPLAIESPKRRPARQHSGQSEPHRQATSIVAAITKSRSSQLRISISDWRGQRRAEIREATALIPSIFFPTSAGVSIDVRQLRNLIEALQAAEAEARRRGWLR